MPKNDNENISVLYNENESLFQSNCNSFTRMFIIALIISIILVLLWRESQGLNKIDERREHRHLVYTSGCRMMDYLPISLSFFQIIQPKRCVNKSNYKDLVSSDDEYIWVNKEAMKSNVISGRDNVTCCYYEYKLTIDPHGCERYKYNEACIPFWEKKKVTAEFLKVHCLKNKERIYIDFHFFIPHKEHVDNRCFTLSKANKRLNVLILGFDAISRAHFQRTMKRTAQLLKRRLGGIEMSGYSRVADNTYPNLLTAFSGKHFKELKQESSNDSYLDACNFIWNDFKLSGYRTIVTEEPWYGFTLQPRNPGFCKSPTDYYSTYAFNEAMITTAKESISQYCYGFRWTYKTLLTYVDRFVRSSRQYPYFGFFFHASFTHEGFNNGYLIDDPYYLFVNKLSKYESFNNTVLIFMSDHGYRSDRYILTKSGQSESSLPLLTFVFPVWFQRKYSTAIGNMKANIHSLTSHFDLYETLKDLINYADKLTDSVLEKRNRKLRSDPLPRGISLFLQIPERRTCKDADIPPLYCACNQHIVDADVKSPVVLHLLQKSINYINFQIRLYPQCAKVTLNSTINAVTFRSSFYGVYQTETIGHKVTFRTNPGSAIFIAIALNADNKIKSEVNNSEDLIEEIKRIDVYKHQSYCIHAYNLEMFCYCS